MEYTEKEKKVIEILENVKSTYGDLDSLDELETDFILDIKEYKALLIGLDLLEKQRKEIEKKNKIITEVERYARGIKDEELLLILKKDEIEKLVNECEELLGDD